MSGDQGRRHALDGVLDLFLQGAVIGNQGAGMEQDVYLVTRDSPRAVSMRAAVNIFGSRYRLERGNAVDREL